eukprot:7147128-Prymnesium_polylepis.1
MGSHGATGGHVGSPWFTWTWTWGHMGSYGVAWGHHAPGVEGEARTLRWVSEGVCCAAVCPCASSKKQWPTSRPESPTPITWARGGAR